MASTMDILTAAKARIAPEEIQIGEQVYLKGHSSGIKDEDWASLRRTKIFLKAPITTPLGSGYKSLNVTIRKTLGLFANVRPVQSLHPFISTKHPKMDLVVVRENEEDLYAGIEHRQTPEVYQCLKVISRPGTERIVRYAFDYARRNGRKKVTLVSKSNIMKLTDGLYDKVFEEIGKKEYPDIARDKIIVDIGAALLADQPEKFDVMVMGNLYGDILSDIAAQISGSVGLGASANIGEHVSMFEAIHGSAPLIAGKNMANPSGLLLASTQMLQHIKQPDVAERIYNAWLRTIEDGLHTGDIYKEGTSKKKLGTTDFTKAVIDRLGEKPKVFAPVDYTSTAATSAADAAAAASSAAAAAPAAKYVAPPQTKMLVGVDIFVNWGGKDSKNRSGDELAAKLRAAAGKESALELKLITNRGVKVWPGGFPETFCTDHWRCRFRSTAAPSNGASEVGYDKVLKVQQLLHEAGVDIIKTENLCSFRNPDGSVEMGFSLGQGE